MKKAFALSLCAIMILTFTLVACSKNDDDGEPTTAPKSTAQASDLDNSGDEYGVETETVTNDRGKAVTDKKGNKVTTDVAVVYKKIKRAKHMPRRLIKMVMPLLKKAVSL